MNEKQKWAMLDEADQSRLSEKQLIASAMAALGRRTSKAKKRAAKQNGKLGGRPKKEK